MAASDGGEKAGLGKLIKSHAKYGATAKQSFADETYIKHKMSESDTLQGISLKYGVPVQHLKRANNIWTNDSLFLREYMLVPVDMSPMTSKKQIILNGDVKHKDTLDKSCEQEVITRQDLNKLMRTQSLSSSQSREEKDAAVKTETAQDFLTRFDSSLAKIKDNIQKIEDQSQLPDDSSNPLKLLPVRKGSRYYSLKNRRSIDLSQDSDQEPQLAFKSSRQSAATQDSVDQVEMGSQDDMFQL